MILNLNPSLDYIFLIFPESHANPLSSDVQENLQQKAGGKLVKARRQKIWKMQQTGWRQTFHG